MPIRHQGEHVGNIYLTEKEGGREFTGEDQDILVMFASQAGAAILNARRHREERQARADLEALVNIAPVGVLLFDARTSDLVMRNQETRRIVGNVSVAGWSLGELLEVLTLRRPENGEEIAVEDLPLARVLRSGETVRAEEIVIGMPDGRSVTTLVNATPVRAEDGEIASVLATLQDITPLQDMERLRSEFLAMVSHELRRPLATIKGVSAMALEGPSALDDPEALRMFHLVDEETGLPTLTTSRSSSRTPDRPTPRTSTPPP